MAQGIALSPRTVNRMQRAFVKINSLKDLDAATRQRYCRDYKEHLIKVEAVEVLMPTIEQALRIDAKLKELAEKQVEGG